MDFIENSWLVIAPLLSSSFISYHKPIKVRAIKQQYVIDYIFFMMFYLCNVCVGTNLVLGQPEKFYRRNPSGTFRGVHWYHLDNPKKVLGAPNQGFLIFLGFDKNITKTEIWLSYPHFWADFQVSYHFGKLLTAQSQGFTGSKNQSLDQ